MAKLAALIMERRHAARFDGLKARLRDVVTLADAPVEEHTFTGPESLCYLIRVGPDPLNYCSQPIARGAWQGVMCGYYLPGGSSPAEWQPEGSDSATGLFTDLAAKSAGKLNEADGVFAYIRWNAADEVLEAGVDKLGMRPLHWSSIPGGYVLASDLKGIIVCQDDPKPEYAAWEERLAFGHPLGDHTQIEGAWRFAEAEIIRFSTRRHQSTKYENFLDSVDIKPYRLTDFLEEQRSLFSDAMRRLTALYDSKQQTMLTLSAGDDSRRILAWLLDAGIRPEVFTVPEVKPDGAEYESGIVADLCRWAGLPGWRVYPRTAEDQALVRRCRNLITDFQSDDHLFCTTLTLALEPAGKINFDGIGGDVALAALRVEAGYLEQNGDDAFLRDFVPPGNNGLLPSMQNDRLKERCLSLLRENDTPNRFTSFVIRQRTRRKISLATHAYQTFTMESLCPYLDRRVLRHALSLHPREKIGTGLQGRLTDGFKHNFAGIPTSHAARSELDGRYTCQLPPIERQEERQLLRKVFLVPSGIGRWRVQPVQKARFLAALLLGARFGESRVQWEVCKANRVHQLVEFDKAIASAETYANEVSALRGVLASRKDFLTRIQ